MASKDIIRERIGLRGLPLQEVLIHMATDYASLEKENVLRYGTDIGELGELFFGQLYMERTHFIYELLQNAEDAMRRRSFAFPTDHFPCDVTFRLFSDRLEVSHYGIPFSEEDVHGICGILRGTKAGDLTQIGKFGIGFKSVYVYTATPHIQSDNERFRIRDFVKPQSISPVKLSVGETRFILPFDRSEVPQGTAFHEICACFESLSFRTLLFLRHIDQIVWEVEDGRRGAFLRESQPLSQLARKVVLSGADNKDDNPEKWLVFEKTVPTGPGKHLPVEIAFLLEKDQITGQQSVVPVNPSRLVVFFPTDKDTHVGFLIQGPYRTTLSRDNVPSNDPWNSKLAAETAVLLAESLVSLRDMGLMNIDLLEALPIRRDEFPKDFMFRPFFDEVLEVFRRTELLPNSDGSYRPATRLKLARPAALRNLISNAQLTRLYGSEDPLEWLHEELSSDQNQPVYRYLTNELEIEVVSPSDVAQRLSQQFLEEQSDEWMIQFYSFLQDQEALWREGTRVKSPGPLRTKPIIRLVDGGHVTPFTNEDHPQAYLPGDHKSYFPTVKRNIVQDKDALTFLRQLGLRKPDTAAEVLEYILPRYVQPETWRLLDETLRNDLTLIVEACRTDSSKVKEELIERLKVSYFVPVFNTETGERTLARPGKVYFRSAELEAYFLGSVSARFVQDILPSDLKAEFDGVLECLGVAAEPRRIEFEPVLTWEERYKLRGAIGCTRENSLKDYDLDGLNDFLNKLPASGLDSTKLKSKILWDFLRTYENEYQWFRGIYSWFYYSPWSKDFPARFLNSLREQPWLPDRDGRLHKPHDLTLNDLPEDFLKSRLLAAHLGMRSDELTEIAAQLGVDEETLVLIREHPNELKQFVKQFKLAKETLGDPSAASQREKPSGEIDFERGTSTEDSSADTDHSSDRSTIEAQSEEAMVRDIAKPKEGSKQLPVIVATGEIGPRGHQSGAGPNTEADPAGVAKVVQYEIAHGRQPEVMSHTNEGFDIKSWDPVKKVTRFIEVKSSLGDWGEANVALSAPQFRFGLKVDRDQEFWLYVVEKAHREDARLHCIPDPARKATDFIYPAGWSKLEKNESERGKS